jgi:hypothetical protein
MHLSIMGKFDPGTVVCNTQSYGVSRHPVWGIVLPKNVFLPYFEQEKGEWPTGRHIFDVGNSHGYYMPAANDRVLPPQAFLDDSRSMGVRCFGSVFSTNLHRELNLEIMADTGHVIPWKTEKLLDIYAIRNLAHEEFGGSPHYFRDVGNDMLITVKYFAGELKGDELSRAEKDMMELFRECGFEEGSIKYE